jgi:hypothetical protein
MPRIVYKGKCGHERKKFFSTAKKITRTIVCEECGGELQRQLSSPTQNSKMVVDNGVQAKATELDRDIIEIIEDREKADLKKRGDSVLDNLK